MLGAEIVPGTRTLKNFLPRYAKLGLGVATGFSESISEREFFVCTCMPRAHVHAQNLLDGVLGFRAGLVRRGFD